MMVGWKWKPQLDWIIKPVPHDLVRAEHSLNVLPTPMSVKNMGEGASGGASDMVKANDDDCFYYYK